MDDAFEQFVREYTKSFGDDTKLIDSLKKQYEMYLAEKDAVKLLMNKPGTWRVQQKQFMPTDFDYFYNRDRGAYTYIGSNMFKFDMGIKNTFATDVPLEDIYLIEGISTTRVTGISIDNISFFIGDKLMRIVAGYQINDLYYLELPLIVQNGEKLRIEVNLTAPCVSFPILFIGYRFYFG